MNRQQSKRCVVVYATREQQYLWAVDVPVAATIAEAIESARQLAAATAVPWESAPVGIFGEHRERTDVPADGDRIEIYRSLASDPRSRRRAQVQRQRKAAR